MHILFTLCTFTHPDGNFSKYGTNLRNCEIIKLWLKTKPIKTEHRRIIAYTTLLHQSSWSGGLMPRSKHDQQNAA